MTVYTFIFINHLGEPFEASDGDFERQDQAFAHAEKLAQRGYPVEVRCGGARVKLVPLMTWKAEEWLDRYRRVSDAPLDASQSIFVRKPGVATCSRCHRHIGAAGATGATLCDVCREAMA